VLHQAIAGGVRKKKGIKVRVKEGVVLLLL
jgi:hypothetical protein